MDPEAAREYISACKQPYTKENMENITGVGFGLEDEMEKSLNPWLFCDTNLLVIKIWMEDVFETCPEWILKEWKDRSCGPPALETRSSMGSGSDPRKSRPSGILLQTLSKRIAEFRSFVVRNKWFRRSPAATAIRAIQKHVQFEPVAVPEKPLHSNPD